MSHFALAELWNRCRHRDRRALSRLLTLLSAPAGMTSASDHHSANVTSTGHCKHSQTIALTGSAGVGKSSLISRLIEQIRSSGQSVAVLSCDPQSPVTGGSLLGDRIRMVNQLPDDDVYIRSLAVSSGSQGISPHLDLMIRALDEYGFDVILIETAGVGQGDVAIKDVVDRVVVLLQPESGDAIQWEKAGLLEIADVIVVHKSDLPGADRTASEVHEHLNLPGFAPIPIVRVSATKNEGVALLWAMLSGSPTTVRSSQGDPS